MQLQRKAITGEVGPSAATSDDISYVPIRAHCTTYLHRVSVGKGTVLDQLVCWAPMLVRLPPIIVEVALINAVRFPDCQDPTSTNTSKRYTYSLETIE